MATPGEPEDKVLYLPELVIKESVLKSFRSLSYIPSKNNTVELRVMQEKGHPAVTLAVFREELWQRRQQQIRTFLQTGVVEEYPEPVYHLSGQNKHFGHLKSEKHEHTVFEAYKNGGRFTFDEPFFIYPFNVTKEHHDTLMRHVFKLKCLSSEIISKEFNGKEFTPFEHKIFLWFLRGCESLADLEKCHIRIEKRLDGSAGVCVDNYELFEDFNDERVQSALDTIKSMHEFLLQKRKYVVIKW